MNIIAFLLFSCFCGFLARAAQTSTGAKRGAVYSLPKNITFHPDFKKLVQQAHDIRLHDKFSSDSFDFSKSDPTVQTIYKAYSVFKNCSDVWSRVIRSICRKYIYKDKVMQLDELIYVGLFRILQDEGVEYKDVVGKDDISYGSKISQVFSKVLNCYVPSVGGNVLPSVTWLFLKYFEMYQEKKEVSVVDTNDSDSGKSRKFAFRPEFVALVREAVDKRFDDIVTVTELDRKLTPIEASIRKTYRFIKDEGKSLPWGKVLKSECQQRKIFGQTDLQTVNEIIPIALARILKAEGADINKLFSQKPSKNWDQNSPNVISVFSTILNESVRLTSVQKIPAVLWLILQYHETFSDKREVLLKSCEEEFELMKDSDEKKQSAPAGKQISNEMEQSFSAGKQNSNDTEQSTPVGKQKRKIPDTVGNENDDHKRRKIVSNNNSSNSSSSRVDLTITEEPTTISIPQRIEFSPDFKKLVQTALNRNLPLLFSKDSLRISTSKPTDRIIHETYLMCKKYGQGVWARVFQVACRKQKIFGSKFMLEDELLNVGFSRILKAEGVDIKDLISSDNFSCEEVIFQVYYKVLDTNLTASNDNLISSVTWLFLEYSRLFPEKKALLWGEHVEEKEMQVGTDKNDNDSGKSTLSNSSVVTSGSFKFTTDFKELVLEAINKKLDDIVTMPAPDRELTPMEASIRDTYIFHRNRNRNVHPWGLVLRAVCRRRMIFGPTPFTTIDELIPIALSRILKAEGADVNKLLPGKLVMSWHKNNTNVSMIFTHILNRFCELNEERINSTILWLILRYHEKYSDKCGILEMECEEELKLLGIGKNAEQSPDTMDLEKRVPKRKRKNSKSSASSLPNLQPSDPITFNNFIPNTISSFNDKPVSSPDFRELVEEAVSKTFVVIDEMCLLEKKIREKYSYLVSTDGTLPWDEVLFSECKQKNIFAMREYGNVEDLIPIALSRILIAEGLDINEVLSGVPWNGNIKNVLTVFTKILNKPVLLDEAGIIISVLWLTLRYHEKYPNRCVILLLECSEELKVMATQQFSKKLKGKKLDIIAIDEDEEEPNITDSSSLVDLTITPPPIPNGHQPNLSLEMNSQNTTNNAAVSNITSSTNMTLTQQVAPSSNPAEINRLNRIQIPIRKNPQPASRPILAQHQGSPSFGYLQNISTPSTTTALISQSTPSQTNNHNSSLPNLTRSNNNNTTSNSAFAISAINIPSISPQETLPATLVIPSPVYLKPQTSTGTTLQPFTTFSSNPNISQQRPPSSVPSPQQHGTGSTANTSNIFIPRKSKLSNHDLRNN